MYYQADKFFVIIVKIVVFANCLRITHKTKFVYLFVFFEKHWVCFV